MITPTKNARRGDDEERLDTPRPACCVLSPPGHGAD